MWQCGTIDIDLLADSRISATFYSRKKCCQPKIRQFLSAGDRSVENVLTTILALIPYCNWSFSFSSSCSSSSWETFLKKAQCSVVWNLIGVKFGTHVPRENTHRLTASDFGYNVILSRWRPWRHLAILFWWHHAILLIFLRINRPRCRPMPSRLHLPKKWLEGVQSWK